MREHAIAALGQAELVPSPHEGAFRDGGATDTGGPGVRDLVEFE